MATEWVSLYNNQVARDTVKTWRWFDAAGPDVTKWVLNANNIPLASSTALSGYTLTAVGTSPVSLVAGADGGAVLITTGGTENNGAQFQPITEAFYFASKWPCYFGCKIQISDATQSDFLAGLTITDTSAASGVSDGVYFWSVDGTAVTNFGTAKGSVTADTAAKTMVDATDTTFEWFFDGTTISAYVDGVLATTTAYSATTVPNTEYLTPMLAFLTGAGAAKTMTIYWARAIQIRQAVL